MADVCVKDLFDLKILEAIDYIKCVGKKKPTKKKGTETYGQKQFRIAGRSFIDFTRKSRKRKHSRKSWRSFIPLFLFKRIYKSRAKKREEEGGNTD